MSADPRSKFIGFIDSDANQKNQRPNIKGEFALANGGLHRFVIWVGPKKDGSGIYLKGKVESTDVTAALTAKVTTAPDVEQPAGLELKVGEIVLFENDKEGNDKRPDFYGYSRTAQGINRHSAWGAVASNGSLMLRGSTDPFVAKAANGNGNAPIAAEPTTPEAKDAKQKVKQALTQQS